jgi:LCP family protein required for cell wall assembly
LRVVLTSLAAAGVLSAAIAAGGILVMNHLASNIGRVPVSFTRLTSAQKTAFPQSGSGSMTVLLTGNGIGPTGDISGTVPTSGLIMLLHVNNNHIMGGVVSIPPQSIVNIPGHGRQPIQNALIYGGPTLLVSTVEQLTNVQIDHYARINFYHVANVVNTIGGVNILLPDTVTSFGTTFYRGINHLNGVNALKYARQPSLTEEGRVLRQQSLIRAVLSKIANRNLLSNPLTMMPVLDALTSMLTVDSDFTPAELASLADELKNMQARNGTFVTAATTNIGGNVILQQPQASLLWASIRHDSIAAFAARYPYTVTPISVP